MRHDFLITSRDADSEPDLIRILHSLEPDADVRRARICEDRFSAPELRCSTLIRVEAWLGLSAPFFDEIRTSDPDARREGGIVVGYSEEANTVAALAACASFAIDGAILVRPTATFDRIPPRNIDGLPVLILSGLHDPVVALVDAQRLSAQLSMAGADVTHRQLPNGHGISRNDHDACRDWLTGVPVGGAPVGRTSRSFGCTKVGRPGHLSESSCVRAVSQAQAACEC